MTYILLSMLSLILNSAFAPEYGWKTKDTQSEVFAAETISVGNVYRGSFTSDGRTFYFFKNTAKGEEAYRIFFSKLVNGKWTEPERLNLGGDYSDLYPSISKNGKRMVFSSYRPAPGDTSAKPNAHLWYVDKKDGQWGTPVFMTAANTLGYYHSWVEIDSYGDIYFRRTTPDWKLNQTFVSRWNGKEYTAPVLFAPVDHWKNWRADVRITGGSLSPDGKLLFLDVGTKNPQTGKGASDIWVSIKKGADWMEPRPLGREVNSDGYDNFHFFSPNGKEFYFVRDLNAFYHLSLKDVLDSVSKENK